MIRREDEPGSEKLVAYVVAKKDVKVIQGELRAFMQKSLPPYMIPSAFVFLEKIPLTPNRKIDRNALPHPESKVEENTSYEPPKDTIEKQLVEIWEEVLGVHPIGIHDNFFELGGHSLLAMKLLLQIQKKINGSIVLSDIYQALTIEGFAGKLRNEELLHNNSSLVCIQPGISKSSLPPLFFIHVLGSGFKFCRPITEYLDPELPVYGLSIQLMDKRPLIDNRVESLARFYIHEVKQIQPDGPYMLIGFSFGGLVAFEMAKQMKECGEDVRLLAIVDATLFVRFKKTNLVRRVKEHYKNWKKYGKSYLRQNIILKVYYSFMEKINRLQGY